MTDNKSPFGSPAIRSDTALDKVIEEARRVAEANERAEMAQVETFVPVDSQGNLPPERRIIKKPTAALYTVVFANTAGELDFDTLPSEEILEKYMSTTSKRALFLSFSRRAVPGDMTMIGTSVVFRAADA